MLSFMDKLIGKFYTKIIIFKTYLLYMLRIQHKKNNLTVKSLTYLPSRIKTNYLVKDYKNYKINKIKSLLSILSTT